MVITNHGFSIGLERSYGDYFIVLKAVGQPTHTNYQRITPPFLDAALGGVLESNIRVLFDARQLDGRELRATSDDFNIGLKHLRKFEKIAIFGHKKWPDSDQRISGLYLHS